ncbi:MAG: CapA family protein [Pseudomonadota bacterium]
MNLTRRPQSGSERDERATLLVVGDTNIVGRADAAEAFAAVRDVFDAADAVVGQMEGMLTDPSPEPETRPDIPFKPWWRHSERHVAAGLRRAGFSAVGAASNVAYPNAACVHTAEACAAAALPCAGVGRNEAEARAPALFQVGSARGALLCYTSVFHPNVMPAAPDSPGCATLRAHTAYVPGRRALEMPGDPPDVSTWADPAALEAMRADIRAARERADVVILSCHWGVSSSPVTHDYQREIARAAAAAGADLIFGHHPHVIHGAEMLAGPRGDVPVFYSLGNFAFDGWKMRGRNLDGLALRVAITGGRVAGLDVLPCRRGEDNLVRVLDPLDDDGVRIMARLRALTEALGGRAPMLDTAPLEARP